MRVEKAYSVQHHPTFTGLVTHDLSGSNTTRGGIVFEIYNNVFEWTPCGLNDTYADAVTWRSGSMLLHNNTFLSGYQYIVNTYYHRGGGYSD
jgi:hypothetical protein